MHNLGELAGFIRQQDGFTLLAHISPDGDTLGSSLALLAMLKRLGKHAQVVCADPVPAIYSFLPLAGQVLLPEQAARFENAIAVDCADAARMGAAARLFDEAQRTALIDHHITNSGYADINAIQDVAATGELVYELGRMLLPDIMHGEAVCLYTALITDTGNFAYSNTTPKTLHTAAELLATGIDTHEVNLKIYRSIPLCKVRLTGVAIGNMRMECGGLVGATTLTLQEMAAVGATQEDTEGIIDHVRDVETVELAILIRQSAEDTYRVSLRSKSRADVSKIARRMGGGGHVRAAGYTAYGSLKSVLAQALELAAGEVAGAAWQKE